MGHSPGTLPGKADGPPNAPRDPAGDEKSTQKSPHFKCAQASATDPEFPLQAQGSQSGDAFRGFRIHCRKVEHDGRDMLGRFLLIKAGQAGHLAKTLQKVLLGGRLFPD